MSQTPAALRDRARQLFDAAVTAADPGIALRRHLRDSPPPPPGEGGRTLVIAVGKAAPAMLDEALRQLEGPATAFGVTHHGNAHRVEGAEIVTAGHPLPDAAGHGAAQRVLTLLNEAGPKDRVIALISGGGSALLPAPAGDLTLDDKIAVNRLLLESGLGIEDMNLIRQQLSELKGGGFLRHAAPAPVTAYILSDVIGDDLRAIASGPTVAPIGTRQEAAELCRVTNFWDDLPEAVRAHLRRPAAAPVTPKGTNILIGSNRQSLDAMCAAAGEEAQILDDRLIGDVADAAERIVHALREAPHDRPSVLLFGGETTVRLKGSGLGGRNQELALRVALAAEGHRSGRWVFLSGGTDGRDGPTDAAGGLVDAKTAQRIRDAGGEPQALLAENDSNRALDLAGDLLITGATGTNVADVQALLVLPD